MNFKRIILSEIKKKKPKLKKLHVIPFISHSKKCKIIGKKSKSVVARG